jgi:FkbM family methyltransferase
MGKGLDKRLPRLVDWYKKIFVWLSHDGLIKVTIPMGKKLWVRANDAGLGLMLRTKGEYEPVQTKWWLDSIKSGMIVVDVGANVGYYSVLARALTDGVVAVEPESAMFALLKKNVNADTYNLALGDKEEMVSLVSDNNPGETRISRDRGRVKMTTFSKLVKRADVVKVDVEGAEPMVLSGIVPGSIETLVCECNPKALGEFGYVTSDLLQKIADCGLKPVKIIDERAGQLVTFSKSELSKRLEKSSYVSLVASK